MDGLLYDLKHACRSLLRTPAFTCAAALALALGIGGSSAIFTVLDGVALRPLAAPEPEQLFSIHEGQPDTRHETFSVADYADLAQENGSFAHVAAVREASASMTTEAGPSLLRAAQVTASFFPALAVPPRIGRGFSANQDREGAPFEVVLTDRVWRLQFEGDPRIVGRNTVVDGRPATVVGVMPKDFHFPLIGRAEVLVPFAWTPQDVQERGLHTLHVFGRLKPGRSAAEAQADLAVVGPRIASLYREHAGWSMRAFSLRDDLVHDVKPILAALLGAVFLVLLIACANVASMLLARGAARQREIAIRSALGGQRMRIVRQLLGEAIVLALIGGALGVVLAMWGVAALLALAPDSIPRLDEVHLDRSMLLFSLAISIAAGVLAGAFPALQSARLEPAEVLKDGSSGATHRSRARGVLVVVEIALALVLVAGAGLMIRTLGHLLATPSGVREPEQVLVADARLTDHRYEKDDAIRLFQRRLLERISAIPGVSSAALMSSVPLDPQTTQWTLSFDFEDLPPSLPGKKPLADVVFVSPGYLATLGIPLLRGRDLTAADDEKAPLVLLVNEAFVRKYGNGRDAVGRRITRFSSDKEVWQIAGVIGDLRSRLDQAPKPIIVVPYAQAPIPAMSIGLRSTGSAMSLLPALREALRAVDPNQPLSRAHTLAEVAGESVGERRFQMMLLGIFALVALSLAALGIYGVMAYTVAQRSREIGIRMALGAEQAQVLRMVLLSGLRLAGLGVGFGLAGAIALTRTIAALLYGVSATDPLTLALVSALLFGVALVASWAPARRATRVDPMIPLRAG